MAAADFNRDGKADLAVIGSDLRVLTGDGHGAFTVGRPIPTGSTVPQTFLAGDFNDDGKLDLAYRTGRLPISPCWRETAREALQPRPVSAMGFVCCCTRAGCAIQ